MRCAASKSSPAGEATTLYRFARAVLGSDTADAEIARRWGMDKKSFWRFKTGRRPALTVETLKRLADVLGASPHVVLAVAGGLPCWKEMADAVKKRDTSTQVSFLRRWVQSSLGTPAGPDEHFKAILFDGLSDLIMSIDIDGNILACNQTCKKLFGYELQDLIGRHKDVLYASKRESDRATRRTRRSMDEREPFREVFRYRRKDGSEFDGELVGSVLFDDEGKPFAGVGIIRDVSEEIR